MNADIIYLLCSYLDLGSLSCFALACPQWSATVHRYLKKRIRTIRLNIQFGAENNDDDNFQSGEGSGDFHNDTIVTYTVGEGEFELPLSHCGGLGYELPKYAWKYLPHEVIEITGISIKQKNDFPLPEEVYEFLATVTTASLFMEFSTRLEARRVFRTVRFRKEPIVFFRDVSEGPKNKEPIVRLSELKNLGHVGYVGRMMMLGVDLLEALDTDLFTYITQETTSRQSVWAARLLDKHLTALIAAKRDPGFPSGYVCDIQEDATITEPVYVKHSCGLDACRGCQMRTIRVLGTGFDCRPTQSNEVAFSVTDFS